ncbi:hypothetical protein [Legionella jordanis]|uniref:Uncharacterized protein n=1 Tax=Legionella jordanis TaxID=456 RepID=A0A0W0V8L2_9GAMM|nr:hypothetical protein [Legionella jordanis]KTD16431.1 hypothetical protein Ljor_0737 [Legionella jordanis]RMX04367.1 hypothetical protein EAW55_02720 [Legionella jordanis]RMX15558.1 hypothetical protein EAS68_11915 [Legionella jordanis]VEH12109.1 Uncharacterised protein [Legionella jordanis]HAT8714994.1 hypothetical protein [Legionella jordanis]
MNFEEELKPLIAAYADFDSQLFVYQEKKTMTFAERQKVEASFIALVCQYLSQDGLDEKCIEYYMKELEKLLHPDRFPLASPEIKWLQVILSADVFDPSSCLNLAKLCEAKLKNPEAPEFHLEHIATMDALIFRLRQDRKLAKTLTERALLDSVLSMLKSADQYNSQLNSRISLIWAQKISQLMPYLTTGYCLSLFLKELALLYAVTYTLTRGGRWIEHSHSNGIQMIGQTMRVFGEAIFSAVTALVARLTELNIFVAKGAVNLSVDASDGLYRILACQTQPTQMLTEDAKSLALAPQDLFGGLRFETFQLKLIAAILEEQSGRLEKQWFYDWRLGSKKNAAIKKALQGLQLVDKSGLEENIKLQQARSIIQTLADNRKINVYGSDTAKAISNARNTLKLLLEPSVAQERTLSIGQS